MKNLGLCFWFIAIALLLSNRVQAQNNNKITGTVKDELTGEVLPGAQILIDGTMKGTISNLDGSFLIDKIDNKKGMLVVLFLGYDADTVHFDFQTNPNPKIQIKLKTASTQIAQVEIKGKNQGQANALLNQKLAVNIKNIVSSEQIEQFPDMNAAEVLQRVPGVTLQRDQGEGRFVQLRGTPPELTNFNINGEQIPSPEGNVRYVGLDVISADQIEFIEVSKVLTPDMDADGIAGTVNIITKTAKEEKPEINFSLAGGFNNLRKTGNGQLQFSFGQRVKKFGFNMNASYYLNNQGSDNMEFKYTKSTFFGSQSDSIENYHVQFREVQLRHYDITRQRIGLSATMDYYFDEKSMIYIRGMYNRYSDDETRRRLVYDLEDAISETYYLSGGIDRDVKDRIKIQDISSVNLGGKLDLPVLIINGEVSYALATESEPNRLESTFDSQGGAIKTRFDLSDPNWPLVSFGGATDSAKAFNYSKYDFNDLLLSEAFVKDKNLTAKIDFQIPFEINDNKGFFKFGAKVRSKEKSRDVNAQILARYLPKVYSYPDTAPKINLTTFDDGFSQTNLLNRNYVIDYIPNPDKLRDFYEYNSHHFISDVTATKSYTYGTDYTANEDIYSTFGMFRIDLNKLMLLGGVRYEKTNIHYEGRRIVMDSRGNFSDIDTLESKRTHEFFLPQFQLKYSLDQNTNFRASITKSYSRPNFEDNLPYRYEEDNQVEYGNVNLKYPTSINIDLLAEKYLKALGILSGGLFYKKIDNFVVFYKRFAHEGDFKTGNFPLFEITKAVNGKKAFVYGAEVMLQTKLSFLPGFLKDFGVYCNYTYTYSEAYINKRYPANSSVTIVSFDDEQEEFSSASEEEKITLPGQAKHAANFALYYEGKKFYAKITANFHDAYLDKIGADNDLDEYYDKAYHLDFNANYKISKNLKAFVDVVNLTNSPLKFYLNTPDRLLKQEYYSWWGRLGVKLEF